MPARPLAAPAPEPRLFEHILCPTDFSAQGATAFNHALRLSLAEASELSLVHVGMGSEIGEEWAAFPRVRRQLERWSILPPGSPREAVTSLGLKARKVDLTGKEPGLAITNYATQNSCDLMVIATHGHRGLERWARDRVAEPAARGINAPTLFLPPDAGGFVDAGTGEVRLRNILIPVDISPKPDRAVALATRLARRLDAADAVIHLLHVGKGHPVVPAMTIAGSDFRWHVDERPVVEAICAKALDVDADLVVMATHGHDGLLDALRGSTTEQVLRRCHRALLAIPAE